MFEFCTRQLCSRQRMPTGITLFVLTLLEIGVHRNTLIENKTRRSSVIRWPEYPRDTAYPAIKLIHVLKPLLSM